MKSAQCILVLSQVMFVLAKPLPVIETLDLVLEARDAPVFRIAGGGGNNRNNNNNGDDDDDGDNENEGAAPPAENGRENGQAEGGEEAGEGEGAENEVEQAGQFDVPITLPGGNKVDTLYPPGQNGVFEIEFQNADSRTLTVTQNPNPAAPPPGFVAVEPVSFIVSVAEGTQGLTLQKVDYILNKNNTLDISKGAIGKFSAEANAFVIDPALGEQEFELEENELLIKTNDMNGEWAAFIPQAAPAAPPAAPPAAGGASATVQEFVGLLVSMLSAGAAPPAQAAEDRK